jgi:hypothetical protein
MPDPGQTYRAEPDPAFADRLERELLRRLAVHDESDVVVETDIDDQELLELVPDDVHLVDRRRSRRGLLVSCLAAAIVAVVAVVGLLATLRAGDGVTTDGEVPVDSPPEVPTPDVQIRRFPLPPEGSTPSRPERGQAVLTLQACGGPSTMGGWSGALHLYADGRLIWLTYGDPVHDDPTGEGGTGPRPNSGWFEQRVTPEGVELMLSELIARGPLLSPEQTGAFCPDDSYQLTVRVGDRDTFFQGVLNQDFVERISDPAAWLPPRAWADRQVRSFVPVRYVACFQGIGTRIDVPSIAAALPPPLDDMIRAREWGANASGPGWFWCTTATTEDARTLTEALDAAGFEQTDQPGWPGPEYEFDYERPASTPPTTTSPASPPPFSDTIHISFSPLLPNEVA